MVGERMDYESFMKGFITGQKLKLSRSQEHSTTQEQITQTQINEQNAETQKG